MKTNCKTILRTIVCALVITAGGNIAGQPLITSQPQSLTNLPGTTAIFSVTATGAPPLAYQWLFDSGIPLASGTNADLVLTNVQSFNSGAYWVVVTNIEGAVTSTLATLTLLTPPTINKQPANQ